MTRQNLVRCFVAASLTLATPALSAQKALSLRVTPQITNAPATVSITITVEPDEKNRVLMVEDDSEDYYRSSEVQLEGEKAARTHMLVFRGLPPGEHRISAIVHGTSGFRSAVSTTVAVIGSVSFP